MSEIEFILGLTEDDGIFAPGGAVPTAFSSTGINLGPEPGTALLMGLGLVVLGVRRRSS